MKTIIIFFSLLIILPGFCCIQNKPINSPASAKITINRNLKHQLFEFLPYGVHGDPNNGIDIPYISNASIFEPADSKHRAFDTCKAYFLKDTLMVEFRSMIPFFTDKLIVKIKKRNYWGYLVNQETNTEILGNPKSLIFKSKIRKTEQEIFGELAIDFQVDKVNRVFSYKGPFRCIIE